MKTYNIVNLVGRGRCLNKMAQIIAIVAIYQQGIGLSIQICCRKLWTSTMEENISRAKRGPVLTSSIWHFVFQ